MRLDGLPVDACGGQVDPWRRSEGSGGQQAAVEPVAQSVWRPGRPCWRPWPPRASRAARLLPVPLIGGSTAEGEGLLARSGTLCDAAPWSVVCACLQAWQAKLRPRWTFRLPGPSYPLPISPPTSTRAHSCCALAACPPASRGPALILSQLARPLPQGVSSSSTSARFCMLLLLHACHRAHVRCCGSGGAAH